MRWLLVAAFLLATASVARAASSAPTASGGPALVPQPSSVQSRACRAALSLNRPLHFPADTDPGGLQLLRERWTALGIPAPVLARPGQRVDVVIRHTVVAPGAAARGPQPWTPPHYAIETSDRIRIADYAAGHPERSDPDPGEIAFDALATLAQLPERDASGWHIPCVRIDDAPALEWRIVSDDVSRGPFPTMAYAKERIRTLASLKINGWSPYMEQVVADPRHPYVAWPNGWTPAQLRELANYARRFHVALIPEQQTFAHMHETLKWEALAPLAELPHGYLLAESDPRTYEYLEPLVRSVVDATRPAPFVHLGSDEPIDLGQGRTPRTPRVFAEHVDRVAGYLAGSGARPMIWDDAIQQDKTILPLLPRETVVVTFHYGAEKTYRPYIDPIANAGFDQMVSPGAANWNELYPDIATSYANVARFVGEAKGTRGMLGMFMTVWHDDGETLYEATWPAIAYAAASAWQAQPVDDASWHRTFARAFFGSDDPRYADALDRLQAIRANVKTTPSDPPDYLFWHDPFDPRLQARFRAEDEHALRDGAEAVLTDVLDARPPLHAQAAAAMALGALRYDALGRRLQIGNEARRYYDDGRAAATKPGVNQVYRSLNVAKYLCWELRDAVANIAPRYAAAWRYESTEPGLAHILPRYRLAEADAQRCADRIDVVEREDYLRTGKVPAWDEVMSSAR